MSLFLTLYFLIFGGMNAYALMKARAAFAMGWRTFAPSALVVALLVLGPMLLRMLQRQDMEAAFRALAPVVYGWFGLVFIFFCNGLALDTWGLAVRALGHKELALQPAPLFFIALGISFVVYGYGLSEASRIRVEHVTIQTDKLPANVKSLRVTQISDIHLGLLVGKPELERIIGIVNETRPDIVVATGDLVDGFARDSHETWALFNALAPRYGKYAVLGNHEYYAGLKESIEFIGRSGFRLLRNESVNVEDIITVAGADFAHNPYGTGQSMAEAENAMLPEGAKRERFVLLLRHAPIVADPARFDLQLSGHTHDGQIFPFTFIVRLSYQYLRGLYELPGGARIYVNRGTGTWGPPIRVLAPPEISVIEIVKP